MNQLESLLVFIFIFMQTNCIRIHRPYIIQHEIFTHNMDYEGIGVQLLRILGEINEKHEIEVGRGTNNHFF